MNLYPCISLPATHSPRGISKGPAAVEGTHNTSESAEVERPEVARCGEDSASFFLEAVVTGEGLVVTVAGCTAVVSFF